MQNLQTSSCRVCGVSLSNDAMLMHELTCLQTSQEQLNAEKNNNLDPNRLMTSRNQDTVKSTALGKEVSNDDILTPSMSSAIPLPQISEVEEDEDQSRCTTSNPSSSVQISEIEEDDDQWWDSTEDNSSVQISEIDDDEEIDNNTGNPGSSNRNTRKNSLVTSTFRYDRKKPKNLFPPTKKYHYYPVTCDYCLGRFQPNELKAHQNKEHFKEPATDKFHRRRQSTATRKGFDSKEPAKTRRKSTAGGMMGRFQFCYICGQMFGSKSIKIHEPQCLKKWRIQNDQLPPELKAPEPIKPEPLMPVAGEKRYSVPGHDPAVEAAFRSHLSSLIPCKYCSRTFSPDRIQRHMSCCIDRPKGREYVTPLGGEIPR